MIALLFLGLFILVFSAIPLGLGALVAHIYAQLTREAPD